ncbi:DSBA oxidoreductase [Thermogemmatispora aurantia]|uniref:DSBA oxidoreductase n=1 Tax=Thermogemmatispora aurantia TaxID=2045279 RepID=A0A5J4K8A4_9CHLR|nr:DsbA family oxidoreductase [Thermogemmatispora aurantia]GER82887.1 DSBA oxidoreductase [Thermogemmatispora aurantia]
MEIEIWSDLVCPWCYIGKRRLEKALAGFPQRERIRLAWRSFQLDPQAPHEARESVSAMLARKYGVSLAEAEAMNARVSALAAQEGLTFHLEQARYGNTFDAHRLLHLAAAHDLTQALAERFFRAYFSEGAALSEPETLRRLAGEVGLPAEEIELVLHSSAYAEAVHEDERRAQELGVQGVPFFLFAGRYAVSGAQPVSLLRQVLERAWRETAREATPQVMTAVSSGSEQDQNQDEACTDGSCALPGSERAG